MLNFQQLRQNVTGANNMSIGMGAFVAVLGMLILSPDGALFSFYGVGPWEIIFLKSFCGSIGLLLFGCFLRGREFLRSFITSDWRQHLLNALVTISGICFSLSVVYTTVANTLFIIASAPVLTALYGWLFLRETIRPITAFAIAIGVLGIVVTTGGSWFGSGFRLADAYSLIAANSFAGVIIVNRMMKGQGVLSSLCAASIVTAIFAWFLMDYSRITPFDVGLSIVHTLIVGNLGLGLYFFGGSALPVAQSSLIALVETVTGPYWAWLLVDETPPFLTFVGGSIIICSLLINIFFSRPGRGKSKVES